MRSLIRQSVTAMAFVVVTLGTLQAQGPRVLRAPRALIQGGGLKFNTPPLRCKRISGLALSDTPSRTRVGTCQTFSSPATNGP